MMLARRCAVGYGVVSPGKAGMVSVVRRIQLWLVPFRQGWLGKARRGWTVAWCCQSKQGRHGQSWQVQDCMAMQARHDLVWRVVVWHGKAGRGRRSTDS